MLISVLITFDIGNIRMEVTAGKGLLLPHENRT
jgi:hypothetical protein